MQLILRPYQVDGVNLLRDVFRRGFRAPLYVLPTGGGKTVVFCYITEEASRKGKRVLILVHRRELLLQCSRGLTRCGVNHGVISPGFTQNRLPIQVGSVQTVIRRLNEMDAPDLVIMDEGHHACASTWERIITVYQKALFLGVTATPCRLDGRGLGKAAGGLFDALVQGPTIQELTDKGYLVPASVYAPPSGVDLSGVHVQMGDFNLKEVDERMDKPQITGCAVTHYRKFCDGKPAIAFCASVNHARHVSEEFTKAGYASAVVEGTMKEQDRDLAMQALADGRLNVLTACDIISEGVDVPRVECGILLRPTWSTGLFLQQVGRCLRPSPGKTEAIILDHVGNCLRHGLPCETREWSLDATKADRRRKQDEDSINIRQCPKCYKVHVSAPVCPGCGYVYPKKERKLEVVDGELKLLTSAQTKERKRYIARRMEQGMSKDLEGLLALARRRGYDERWAYHVWRERQRKEQKNQIRTGNPQGSATGAGRDAGSDPVSEQRRCG